MYHRCVALRSSAVILFELFLCFTVAHLLKLATSHMNKTRKFCIALLLIMPALSIKAADTTTVVSPDKQIQFKLFPVANKLSFKVVFKGVDVVQTSPLVASLNRVTVTDGAKIGTAKSYVIKERYPWYGVHSTAINECNGAKISLIHKQLAYTLDVRVFNDGAAFQLNFPGAQSAARIPDEATVFNLPKGSTVWYHDMNMHYESVHTKKEISQLQEGEWVAPPGTIKLPQGVYAAITEADLKGYPGMSLQANGNNGLVVRLAHNQPTSYPYRLRYSPEDTQRLMKPAVINGNITTPWRVVMIGADLNTMVNNDIVHNLCPAPDKNLFPNGINTDWIKPGRAVWKYLNGGGDGTVEVMKHFTDGAAKLGFEHNLLEGFWSRWTDEQIKDFVQYSKERNVSIWFWKHSKSLRNKASRDSFFTRCHDLGVAGVKLDFFDHEAKEVVDLYEDILMETAKHKLLVDFHGANKPTGMSRTYPNEMIREAVKGMEASKLADRATHETTIPFTRWLAGPAEYTVVHLGARKQNTTPAHQVASAAILSAPVLTYAVNPDSLPGMTVDMVKSIPATWDETIVLPGSEIGELAAYARRKGTTWFLAVINGNQMKQLKVPLSFLGNGSYSISILKDDSGSEGELKLDTETRTAKEVMTLSLVPGGGFIARFTR
ncbi:MAG: glycoside hydrolase [Segetibacter sp.]|nr:glycoside hydrolase [Segetibacter sp.]